jgi:PAS domain S-box-containing protein
MKRPLLLLLLAAAAGGVPVGAGAEKPASITVVSDDNYPPYVFRDTDGTLQGILPDEWALWQQKTGIKVELKAMDWALAKQTMLEGRADVIDTIFRTPEREQLYDFTPPYAQIEVPVFSHKTLGGINDVPALHGFTVGVKAGDAVIDRLKADGIDSLKEYPSYEAIIRAAKTNGLKVFTVDQPAAIYYLYKYGIADQFRQDFVIYTGEFHRAVQKNQPELLSRVNDGFSLITRREHRAIEQKWMGMPFRLKDTLRDWLPMLFLVAGLVSMLAVGNLVLRKRVRARTAELNKALEALQQSQDRLRSIFQVAPVGVGILVQRKFLEVNDTFCTMSGYTRAELIGQPTQLLYVSQEEHDRVGRMFYESIARTGFVSTEVQGLRKNGEGVRWLLGGTPLNPTRLEEGIIFSAMDITARQKAEAELRASQEYFATVFDAINDALFIHDAETGQVLDANRRAGELFGYSRAELLANGIGPLCTETAPYTLKDAEALIQKARTEGPQIVEWLVQHRDGHCFRVEISIRSEQIGDHNRVIVATRDISERKCAEEERLRYERRLQETQRLESLGLLAGGIAHDFNNLLAAILGNIELALMSIPEKSSAHEDIQAAVNATKRAAELVQQMLAYSGKGRFLVEAVDMSAIIRDTVQLIHTSVSKNAQVHLRLPESLPLIEADATQLRQVIMNLVINASEALENRAGTIDVSAGTTDGQGPTSDHVWPSEPLPPGTYVYIEVADTGIGMSPEMLNRIFDPFYSTKFIGRGLGLPVVLGIVRSHKGAIQVESKSGQGTVFRVVFPANPLPSAAQFPSVPVPVPAPPGWSGSGRLILLVDDDQGVIETCVKLLTRLGFQVLCAVDGHHAIHLFRAQAQNVAGIILDLTMPNLDGAQALAEIRRIRPDVPVIVSSGHSEQEVMQRFAGLETDGFLQKPYTLEGLRNTLGHLLPS